MENNTDIKITDDFLAKNELDNLLSVVERGSDESDFGWYITNHNQKEDDPDLEPLMNKQFVHLFFHCGMGGWLSQHSPLVHPVMDRINPFCLLRIKMNLLLNHGKPIRGQFHTDLEREEISNTGIFYLDTTNGPTEFEDGSVCNSVMNRFVQFPSTLKHRSVSQTDTAQRRVINFNWIPINK